MHSLSDVVAIGLGALVIGGHGDFNAVQHGGLEIAAK